MNSLVGWLRALAGHCRVGFTLVGLVVVTAPHAMAQDPDLLIPPPPSTSRQPQSSQLFPLSPDELAQESELEKAERQLREYLELHPNDQEAMVRLALVIQKQGRTIEAIEYLNKKREAADGARLSMGLGQLYLEIDEPCCALEYLRHAQSLNPNLPDVNYWMGAAELRAGWPLQSFWTSSQGTNSNDQFRWAQQLSRGAALAALGLQCEASGEFMSVYEAAGEDPLGLQALELQRQMDQALRERERFRGSLRIGVRYDDNPGVVPTTNIFGVPSGSTPTVGNSYVGAFSYDLYRDYNRDVVVGYNILHTSNYEAVNTDLLDNAVWMAGTQRGLIGWYPFAATMRFDYDHLSVGSDSFLDRYGVTPSFTLQDTDFDSTTVLFRYTNLDFLNQQGLEGTVLDADSNNYSFGIFRQHEVPCKDVTVFAGYLYDFNESEGGNFDYDGHQLQTGLIWLLPWRKMQLNLTGQVYFRNYDDPDAVFGVQRDDTEYVAQAALLYPLKEQLYLTVGYLFDRNVSNLPSSEYDRNMVEIGIQYNFPQGNTPGRGLIRNRTTY